MTPMPTIERRPPLFWRDMVNGWFIARDARCHLEGHGLPVAFISALTSAPMVPEGLHKTMWASRVSGCLEDGRSQPDYWLLGGCIFHDGRRYGFWNDAGQTLDSDLEAAVHRIARALQGVAMGFPVRDLPTTPPAPLPTGTVVPS